MEEYDTWSLFPMFVKCHHVLEFETMANQLNDEDFCFDIFEMTTGTSELAKELVNRECFGRTKLIQRTLNILRSGEET
jgi:hypothetical protein